MNSASALGISHLQVWGGSQGEPVGEPDDHERPRRNEHR